MFNFEKLETNLAFVGIGGVSIEEKDAHQAIGVQPQAFKTGNIDPNKTDENAKLMKVDIIANEAKFDNLKKALNDIGITGMTVTNVQGYGIQKGQTAYYRGVEMEANLLPKIRLEIVVSKTPVSLVIETARQALYTGTVGDGKIFVYPVENVIRVSSGVQGSKALEYDEEEAKV